MFFCGTGAQVTGIGNVDGRAVGTGALGPITERIQKTFFDTVKGQDRTYEHLLTKVPVRP